MSNHLDVITTDVAEAISKVGGLMVDSSLAGWHVRVVTNEPSDSQPLAILGAGIESAEQREPLPLRAGQSWHVIVLAPDDVWPSTNLTRGQHELSSAAKLFKSHALRAIGLATDVQPVEEYWVDQYFGSPTAGRSQAGVNSRTVQRIRGVRGG